MVELRTGLEKPHKRVSRLTHKVMVPQQQIFWLNEAPWSRVEMKMVAKRVVMQQVTFIGGEVLGYVKPASLFRRYRVHAMTGGLTEMSPEATKEILAMNWEQHT